MKFNGPLGGAKRGPPGLPHRGNLGVSIPVVVRNRRRVGVAGLLKLYKV